MSRLTRHGEKHKNFTLLNHDCKLGNSSSFCQHVIGCNKVEDRTCPFLEALDKLAAFEDTNLEPSEILALKAEVERLKDTNKALEIDNYNLDMNLTRLSEELDELKSKTIK